MLLLTVLLCASACQAELRDATVYDEAVAADEQILAYLDTHIDAPQGDDTAHARVEQQYAAQYPVDPAS